MTSWRPHEVCDAGSAFSSRSVLRPTHTQLPSNRADRVADATLSLTE